MVRFSYKRTCAGKQGAFILQQNGLDQLREVSCVTCRFLILTYPIAE